jgi:hypothetical protein
MTTDSNAPGQSTDWIYKGYAQRTWDSESSARERLKAYIIEDNERYPMFKPNDPAIVDSLRFTRARGGKVRLLVPARIANPNKGDVRRLGEPELARDESGPRVDFESRDLQDRGSPVSIAKEFGERDCVIYQSWVPRDSIPKPRGAGISDGYPDLDGDYDWSELRRRGEPPAPKVRVGPRGKVNLLDGNHRCAWWRDGDYTHFPAWVIDERLPVIAELKGQEGVSFFAATDIASARRHTQALEAIDAAGLTHKPRLAL